MSETETDTAWKDQLGYVSGTILVWGVLLIQLWPLVAGMQVGNHVRLFNTSWRSATLAEISFRAATVPLALGLVMILFGSLHVIARGLWLSQYSSTSSRDFDLTIADRLAFRTYLCIQVLWLLIVFVFCFGCTLAVFVTIGQGFLMSHAGLSETYSALIPSIVGALTNIVIFLLLGKRYEDRIYRFIRLKEVWITFLVLFVTWGVAITFCYTVQLSLKDVIYKQSDGASIVVLVNLGGAASDPANATLTLHQNNGSQVLAIHALGGGTYLSPIPIRDLSPGKYDVTLSYPHPSVSSTIPFVTASIEKHLGFEVVP